MFVPRPRLADEGEAVARVAVPFLQKLAGVAGSQIGGGGGVAVMQDAGDGQGRAAFGAPQRGVEVVERAVAIVQGGAHGRAVSEQARRRADVFGRGVGLPWTEGGRFGGEFDDRGSSAEGRERDSAR